MKVSLVLVVLCLAFASSEAFRGIGLGRGLGLGFRGGFGLGFGRFGLGFGGLGWGLGWGAPWRWGLGPWGMGGLGFGGIGMVPPIIPPVAPVAPAVAVAKRAAVEPALPAGLIVPQINNGTVCTYAEKKSILSCLGNTFNFECPVVPNNLVDFMPIRIRNLTVVLDERIIDGVHIPIFRLFSRVGHVLNNFSLVSKDKEVVLSVFNNERLAEETGLRVKDTECWTAFVRMYREVVPNTVDFDFVESHVSTVPVAPRV